MRAVAALLIAILQIWAFAATFYHWLGAPAWTWDSFGLWYAMVALIFGAKAAVKAVTT